MVFNSGLRFVGLTLFFFLHLTASSRSCQRNNDGWLENPKRFCNCSSNNSVTCFKLNEPVCMDMKGIFRSNSEIWMNNSCVTCSCSNGNISCIVYHISIAYGMFTVKTSSTCERCSTSSITQKALTACEGTKMFRWSPLYNLLTTTGLTPAPFLLKIMWSSQKAPNLPPPPPPSIGDKSLAAVRPWNIKTVT